MLYSILSQINKGLRRISILRKSEIDRSLQFFGRLNVPVISYLSDKQDLIPLPLS